MLKMHKLDWFLTFPIYLDNIFALDTASDNKIFDGMTHVHTWWDNVSTQRWGTNHNHGRIHSIIESNINVSQWIPLVDLGLSIHKKLDYNMTCD